MFTIFTSKTTNPPVTTKCNNEVSDEKKNILTIRLNDGTSLKWTISNWNGKKYTTPWKDFLKWYFGKTSNEYLFTAENGASMIKRDNIKIFTIMIEK